MFVYKEGTQVNLHKLLKIVWKKPKRKRLMLSLWILLEDCSFEQFCINLTNENLQQHFNQFLKWSKSIPKKKSTGVLLSSLIIKMFLISLKRIIMVHNLEVIIAESEVTGNLKQLPEDQPSIQNPSTINNAAPSRAAPLSGASGSLPTSRFNTILLTNHGSNPQNFQPTVQPSYKSPPNYRIHRAMMKNEAPFRVIPITVLNPYQG